MTRKHTRTRHGRLAAAAAVLAVAAAFPSTALASYGWPVKPFDRQHPVRGSFGDPRTVYAGPPTLAGLLTGACECSFHEGVDIAAPDGTEVYPVEDGVVDDVDTRKAHELVEVVSAGGVRFQYWHIRAAVRDGQVVRARATVLGRILHEAGHVHLTEVDGGTIVNPLAPGHLSPYRDTTVPSVGPVTFRAPSGATMLPLALHGRIELDAEAYDSPALPVPGLWHAMPVAPARVSWQIVSWNGRPTGLGGVPFDVRHTIPPNGEFWQVYARGTFQNMCVFGKHYSWLQPGRFVFRLATLDSRRLSDGVYELRVTAADIAGNASTATTRFTVRNGVAA
jgi:murein DD-endopeptidase MepM/ murein hydrolase activator NlpD